ncbi:M23 family metallopeptidase [Microbacterium tenebrionis]|uniref:M23 family metallopeptidase n=1 Tax=Microbacterium tenebrionis TaxID=2830665 RepID=UPI00202B3BDB|nr:M23 family metallopeptidase [Microbacterium ihumii]
MAGGAARSAAGGRRVREAVPHRIPHGTTYRTSHGAPHATRSPGRATGRPPRRRASPPVGEGEVLGATLAVGAMITGVALPALNPGADPVSAADGVSVTTAASVETQSYSSTDEIRAEIAPRGNFSATTPQEIEETRSKAVAAAISAGMPLASAVDIPIADEVVMPMAAGTYSFTDSFGASRPGRSHLGQDFAAPVGTPIRAAMDGCVSRSTESYQGYGVTIQIESVLDGRSVSTVYSHMVNGSRAVEVGDCVKAGDYLADVGSTGYVFGSCLHFEVHVDSTPIDPMPWLSANVK